MAKPLSISLVGSFRQHYADVVQAVEVFADAGLDVRSPVVSRIVNPGDDYVRFASDPPASSDQHIQQATFERIFASDVVYVVAPGGYIGRATSFEIGRIVERGIPLYYSEPPVDHVIAVPAENVISPQQLAQVLTGGQMDLTAPPRPRVSARLTADLVVFTLREGKLHVLLVERGKFPFEGKLALPGGFVRPKENWPQTARRELMEETGLDSALLPLDLRELGTYSEPDRDPRYRVASAAYMAIAPDLPLPTAGTDAASAQWVEVSPALRGQLAFDHEDIVSDALRRARKQLEYTTVAAEFCGDEFTIADLRHVYEAIWSIKLDQANFHRKVVKSNRGFIEPVGRKREKQPGRPADLYRRGRAKELDHPIRRTPEQRKQSAQIF